MADTSNKKVSTSPPMEGFFKTRYGQLHKLCPKQFNLQRRMPFSEAERLGDKYAEVALVQNEHGVAYAAAGEDDFLLKDAVAGATKATEIQGCQHMLKVRVGINAIKSAMKRGETAFASTMDMVVENANDSLRKRVEIDMFWGQDTTYGIARVASVTSDTITVAAAEWAPGIWAGAEGAIIEMLASGLGTSRGTFDITSVDIANRQITGDTSGTAVSDLTGEAATDVLLFNGQYSSGWKTQVGLYSALNTSSGDLFGVDVGSSLWKPCTYAVGSTTLTFQKVQKALYQVQSKGFQGDMVLIVNPTTWADLLDDEVAVRRHTNGGVKQYEVGAEGIKFYCAAGTVTIESSIYVKEGWAFLIPDGKRAGTRWRRIGAADVGFDDVKGTGGYVERISGYAAYEFRLYDNQAIYTGRPGYSCSLSGIVNAT